MATLDDPAIVKVKDILAFYIDGLGYLATSALSEPIAESEESITQLRVAKASNLEYLDYTRCAFRVEADSLQKPEILFGSVIQLVSVPSELYLVGTAETDNGYIDGSRVPHNIYLRRKLVDDLNVAHKWIVQPRFKLRNEGDPVRVNDHVILRNAQHKHLMISSFVVADESYENLVALDTFEHSQSKSGLKVIRMFSPYELVEKTEEKSSAAEGAGESEYLCGSDFIRLAHREYSGHVLARLNDEKEISSVVTPFGSVSRKNSAPKDHAVAVVVRPFHIQQPKTQYDFATAYSCLGIWQILLVKPYSDSSLQGKIRKGTKVRLRNLVTGQYLAIRPAVHADIDLLLHKPKEKSPTSPRSAYFDLDTQEDVGPSSPVSPLARGSSKRRVTKVNESGKLKIEVDEPIDVDSIKFMDEEEVEKDIKSSIRFKVTLVKAVVPDMKKMEWFGKNNPYLTFSFEKRFKAQTEVIENAHNEAQWDLIDQYQGMHFESDDLSFVTQDLNVNLMNKHSLFRDSVVGGGSVSLENIRSIPKTGDVDLVVPLFNKRKRKIGQVKLTIQVERLTSAPSVSLSRTIEEEPLPDNERLIINPEIQIQRSGSSEGRSSKSPREAGGGGGAPTPRHVSYAPPTSPYQKNLEWIVATSSEPTEFTTFVIHALNKENSTRHQFIRYEDNVYFESPILKHRFQLVPPSSGRCISKWWEYKEDARLEPKIMNTDFIVDSEVFLLEKAALYEVQDTLYASRILPLARAVTVTLQLTPSVNLLYSPMFRHFKKYIHTLALWSLGAIEHDGSLLPEEGNYPKQKPLNSMNTDIFEDVEISADENDDEDNNMLDPLGLGFLMRSEDEDSDRKETNQHAVSFYHGSPTANRSTLNIVNTSVDKSNFTSSSLFPWLGRRVGTDFFADAAENSPLSSYAEFVVEDVVATSAPTNPVMMRRQTILFDLKLMEQLMHFLNVFFILQRAISYTQNQDILTEYAGLPLLVQQCSHAVHLLLSATVHFNERNALKLLSIRGSLLSLISQKILGWNPPLESIVKIAFESAKSQPDPEEALSRDRFRLEDVLVHSITASDIRQILEQMNEMNHQADPAATNLLSLLTLLCQAGNAKKYFQNIIIRYIITCEDPEVTKFTPDSSFGRNARFRRDHDSALFQTDFKDGEWMVRFQSAFVPPPQEDRNEEAFAKELLEEGESLKNVFNNYNRAEIDNDVLDLEECFLLLEDLGFGGPFLYEEIGQLMGSNIWGFFLWWCYRSSYFYPSSSVAHSQISPIQAMKLIDPNVDDLLIMMELNRRKVDRDSIMRSLRFQSIINSRISGLNLIFSDPRADEAQMTDAFYWRRMKKTQSTLGIKINPIRKMKTSKMKERLGPKFREWVTFTEALTVSPMKSWLRGSVKLLAAVCEGCNTLAQRVVSVLMPAECLVSILLNTRLTYNDKSLFCDLLTNVYIDHLFVFPTRCIPVRRSGLYCAMDEDIFNPAVSLGKVFNPLSRVCTDGPSYSDGSQLRNQLFEFIKKEAGSFIFYSPLPDIMSYYRALLRVFRKLLYQGFFGELDFYFLDFTDEIQSSMQIFYFYNSKEDEEYLSRPTNLKEFELLLLKKLTAVKDLHRAQDVQNLAGEKEKAEEALAIEEAAAAAEEGEGVELVPVGHIRKSSKLFKKKKKTTEEKAMARQKLRKKFVSIFDDLATYDRIFSDVSYTSLMHSGISALGEFMEIRQMYRVQKLWNHIGYYAGKFALFAYGNDLEDPEKLLDDKNLYTIFDDLIHEQFDDQAFVDAVFCGILHPERALIQECLQLLDRRLSLYRGIHDLIECANFVARPSHAIINRCVSTYLLHLSDLVTEVLDSDNQRRLHTLEIMDFLMENVISLLLRSDLEKFETSLKADMGPSHQVSHRSFFSNDDGDVEHSAKTRFVKDRNKVIIYYLVSIDVPCPVGEDDFFLLDLKSLNASPERLEDLFAEYSESFTSLKGGGGGKGKPNFDWLVDAKSSVTHFTQHMVNYLPAFLLQSFTKQMDDTDAEGFRVEDLTWEDLPTNQQMVLEKVFTFLSYLWKGCDDIPQEWFPKLTNLLLALYPQCNGAAVFLHTLIGHTTEERIFVDVTVIDRLLKDLSMYDDGVALPIKFRLMLSLLVCKNRQMVKKGGILMIDQLQQYFQMKFRVLMNVQPGSTGDTDAFNSLAMQIIEPIYNFLTSPVWPKGASDIPESFISGLQMLCTPKFCEMILSHKQIHLFTKQRMIHITLRLYSIDDFPLEDLVLRQLRSMRLFLHVKKMDEARDEKKDLSAFSFFYFQGILPYVNQRLLETNILSSKIIFGFIQGQLQQQKEKLLNKQLGADMVVNIAKLFEPPLSEANVGELSSRKNEENSESSYLPVEMVNCTMIVLNCLAHNDAALFRETTMEQKKDLIWVCAGILLFLQSRPDFIFDRELNTIIDMKHYEKVRDRLHDILEGLLLDFISNYTEKHLQSFYTHLLLNSFRKIIKDSFENTNTSKATISLHSILKQRKASKVPETMKHLKQGLNISVSYNRKFLKRTALFRTLQENLNDTVSFVNRGGMALYSDNIATQIMVGSKAFAKRFSSTSVFDLWLKGNGRYLSHILMYLGDILQPKQFDYNFVHIVSLLLDHSIEDIQENPFYSTNYRLSLIQAEQGRLHEVQNALAALGCLEMTVKVFGRSFTSPADSEYMWKYTPLILKLAAELIAWQNKKMQATTLDLIENAIMIQKPPERFCLVGLQKLLRKAATDIVGSGGAAASSTATSTAEGTGTGKASAPESSDEQVMKVLRALVHFCSFAGALCSGDNSRSQRFLVGVAKSSDGGGNSRLFVNLTHDACILVNAVIVRFTDMITYIKNENFINRLAPFIYEAKYSTKRRFLAWHDRKNNFPLMIQLVYSLSVVFENCISLCSGDSIHALLKALPKTPELLEFFGVLQLTATTNMGSGSLPGVNRAIVWKGGHPVDFYRTLIREMKGIDAFNTDPDFVEYAISYKRWMEVIKRQKFIFSPNSYFHLVFGITYDLFMDCVKKNENACLRLILSALEVAPRGDTAEFVRKFEDSILVQNLDSSFKRLVWTFLGGKDQLTSTTVSYVSLIESIGRVESSTDELLTDWDSTFTGIGVTKPKSIYGSVELLDPAGRIRRLYFPIPSFVTQFWTYPEVQKTKEAVVYDVVRTSPEEKIGDFLLQMNRITVVMKRQERLSLFLTYPVHSLFGGKSIPGGSYLPKQNNLALFLTIGLNAYYVYYNTHPFTLPELTGGFLDIYDWDERTMTVYIVEWIHFLLLGAYAFRCVLNSDAADDVKLFGEEGSSPVMKVVMFIINLPYAIFLIARSAAWPLLLALMSFWALYNSTYWLYTPCLLDMAFQYEVMSFLFRAISRNVFRIGATLLLSFLCLYFYSIIAFLYIGKQYNLSGFTDCVDPGACFKLHLDYGLANPPSWTMPGYISPDLGLHFPYSHQVSYVLGTIYNLSYVILINLVLQALISGLIIDTFSEMRQEREDTQEDIDTKCFMCSIKRDEFEQRGISYQTHIQEEHNMWHYLWFKLYLELKDPLGFSSTENYAFRNFSDKQTFVKMMPIKRSLTLESVMVKDQTEDEKRAQEMEELKKMIEKLQLSQNLMMEKMEAFQTKSHRRDPSSP